MKNYQEENKELLERVFDVVLDSENDWRELARKLGFRVEVLWINLDWLIDYISDKENK